MTVEVWFPSGLKLLDYTVEVSTLEELRELMLRTSLYSLRPADNWAAEPKIDAFILYSDTDSYT